MKRLGNLTAGACAALLCGCLSSSGPLWLQSGKVEMAKYEDAQVIVLPIAIAEGVNIENAELRIIQDQITRALRSVFALKVVNPVPNDSDYPPRAYGLEGVEDAASIYPAAQAIVAITVVDERRDANRDISSRSMQIIFADAEDTSQNWIIRREYRSDSGFDPDSVRFSSSVTSDFVTTRARLSSANGPLALFMPRPYTKADAPRVYVGLPADVESKVHGTSAELRSGIETSQNVFIVRVEAKDAGGLRDTIITNSRLKEPKKLVHSPAGATHAIPKVIELVEMSLEPGPNNIEIVTTNLAGRSTRHGFVVSLSPKSVVNAVSVEIREYPALGKLSPVESRSLQMLQAADRTADNYMTTLREGDATAQKIRLHLYETGLRTVTNDQSIGVFHFAGKAVVEKSGVYLATYDSKEGLIPVTSIDVRSLGELLPKGSGFVLLDLCETDEFVQSSLRAALADLGSRSAVSFTSCEGGDGASNSVSSRVLALRSEGKSLKDAIEGVVDDQPR